MAAPEPTIEDARISWCRSPVDKVLLSELMRRSNFRGWLQTLSHLGWFAATATIACLIYEGTDATNWT